MDSSDPEFSSSPARILEGARKHFLAHGFRNVTMDDLATELGMSKKTLYQHFSGKRQLLEAVLEQKLSEAAGQFSGILADPALTFPERLHAMLDCIRSQTSELSPAFLRDMERSETDLFAYVRKRRAELIGRYWKDLFAMGQESRMIRQDVSLEIMIGMLQGAADAVVNPVNLAKLGKTPREVFTELITIFIEGIATEKGRLRL